MSLLRRLHRYAGVALTLPLLLWMGTGLLFHLKHRYAEAYEDLQQPQAPSGLATRSPAEVAAAHGLAEVALAVRPDGRPIYLGTASPGAPLVSVDGQTLERLEAAPPEQARRWVEEAVRRSPHRHRYGALVGEPEATTHASRHFGAPCPASAFRYAGGKRVTVNLVTGELTQTGELNDVIDLTYRLHYLRWTGQRGLDLLLLGVAGLSMPLMALTGLLQLRRRR